jgi:hypothetical protein
MTMQSQINNPSDGVVEEYVSAIASAALADGDVVVHDLSTNAKALGQYAAKSGTSAGAGKIMGVVSDPQGNGILEGQRFKVMKKGYHPAVKKVSGTMTIGAQVVNGGTAAKAKVATAAATAGAQLGHVAKAITAADTATFECRVDVK